MPEMKRPFLWAHRGTSKRAPENTMAAFNLAVESGADGIELDVHLSRDGVPVVIHDETLDRTTDGRGPVAWATSQRISQLDAGGWFSWTFAGEVVPTLREVLAAFGGRLRLNLELKDRRAGESTLELLKNFQKADVVISSFDHGLLRYLREQDSKLSLAVLQASGNWRGALLLAKELSACTFNPAAQIVTRPMISACGTAGLPVHVWTVDRPSLARSLSRAGVAGFFSNDPAVLKIAFAG